MLNKEYSDKGSPYAEYYIANNQVVSQKMFGLHGLVTPGKEESLKTTGGLMYYQYDRGNTVTELTDRHGDEIEHYRYDAFGNIFTGITSPYNTTGYTGQDYDDLAGLVQMDARWYSPSMGRFTSQDTYMGDMYSSQSLNRYSYVMNNPVNMWDPTGHVPVPTWVGDDTHLDINGNMAIKHELLSSSSSNSGWYNIGTVDNGKEIIYKYQATITKTWVYKRYLGLYDERIDDYKFILGHNVTYSQTDYYFDDVVVPASKIAEESEKAIQELVGNPPKNTDPPVISIRTKQVGKNPVQLMNDPEEIIVMNTGNNQTEAQSLITGAVQSELKAIMDIDLKASGVYGNSTEGAVTDFQEASNLLANGALTYETFYKIQNIYGQYKEITDKLNNLYNTDGASSSLTANLEKKLRELVAPYRNKGTGDYEFKGESWLALAEGNIPYIYSTKDSNHNPWTGSFDSSADLTFGIGHSIKTADEFNKIKKFINTHTASEITAEVQRYLKNDLAAAVETVNNFSKKNNVTLKQNQFDAIVALVFNVPDALSSGSDLAEALTTYGFNKQKIIDGFTYTKFQGGRIDGLVTRRNNELNLFFNADYNHYYDSKQKVINAGIAYIPYL